MTFDGLNSNVDLTVVGFVNGICSQTLVFMEQVNLTHYAGNFQSIITT